jgi:hypothetical protein
MKTFIFVACLLLGLFFIGCNACNEDHCKLSRGNAIKIRFNMDSLNGGFTKAQLKNVSINEDGYIFSLLDSTYYIKTGGDEEYKFITIKNNATSTQNSFTSFQYSIDKPKCCPALQNHNITSLLFNGNTITPTSTPLIIINNN